MMWCGPTYNTLVQMAVFLQPFTLCLTHKGYRRDITIYQENIDSEISKKYLDNYLQDINVPSFSLPTITRNDLEKVLKSMLKTRTTLDLYDISVNILLCIWPVLSDILVTLINEMFTSGEYPDVLKCTRVCPVYKGKGEKHNIDNYRPITIVPNISKMIESIISTHLMMHLESHDLLSDKQFAYRQQKSTTTAAHRIMDCIITGMDDRYKVASIFCDLSKAFDVINHKLLLDKLDAYGIRNNAYNLLHSFLTGRNQTVQVSSQGTKLKSEAGDVKVGIPQGSSLGNTLFLAFINDLPSIVTDGLMVLFADDTTVVVSAKTYDQLNGKICRVCEQLQRWFSASGLILNVAKSNVMLFSSKTIAVPQSIRSPMPLCDICKFLGFTVDAHLNWKQHVDVLCGKLSSAAFALRKLKPLISASALQQTYFAYFHSIMSYGSILWGNSTDAERVLIMQKRALRAMAGVNPMCSCRELFRKYGIMTHFSQYLFEVIMYVRQNLPNFERVSIPGRVTRRTGRLKTVPHRMVLAEKNPRIIGPTFYERLPSDLRVEPSDEKFGYKIKTTEEQGTGVPEPNLYSVILRRTLEFDNIGRTQREVFCANIRLTSRVLYSEKFLIKPLCTLKLITDPVVLWLSGR
ncbi:reverse transcriptase (RNA-dependent DNA polymerase) domain-containing protein [Phthorimaea operculella]|nr:reverse transcriptase (RNA-dependent DNA polymerase) domain-containing protein [Phthorimaea operculella]